MVCVSKWLSDTVFRGKPFANSVRDRQNFTNCQRCAGGYMREIIGRQLEERKIFLRDVQGVFHGFQGFWGVLEWFWGVLEGFWGGFEVFFWFLRVFRGSEGVFRGFEGVFRDFTVLEPFSPPGRCRIFDSRTYQLEPWMFEHSNVRNIEILWRVECSRPPVDRRI